MSKSEDNWEDQFRKFWNSHYRSDTRSSEAKIIKSFISSLILETEDRVREERLAKVKQHMLDSIYYIGKDLPQVKDQRDKFVLLGSPQSFLDSLTKKEKVR